MTRPQDIEAEKERLKNESDDHLVQLTYTRTAIAEDHIAAVQLLRERQESSARERHDALVGRIDRYRSEIKGRHQELLAAVKKPHWSTTPAFWVAVLAMCAACIAAYPTVKDWLATPSQTLGKTGSRGKTGSPFS
jgi:hypothetical protein